MKLRLVELMAGSVTIVQPDGKERRIVGLYGLDGQCVAYMDTVTGKDVGMFHVDELAEIIAANDEEAEDE